MLILLDINQPVNHNYFIHPHFCFDDVVVSVSSALSPVSLFVGMVDHTYFTHRKIKTTTFFSGLSARARPGARKRNYYPQLSFSLFITKILN